LGHTETGWRTSLKKKSTAFHCSWELSGRGAMCARLETSSMTSWVLLSFGLTRAADAASRGCHFEGSTGTASSRRAFSDGYARYRIGLSGVPESWLASWKGVFRIYVPWRNQTVTPPAGSPAAVAWSTRIASRAASAVASGLSTVPGFASEPVVAT
jgi:hypothetical protein